MFRKKFDARAVLAALRTVVPHGAHGHHEPSIGPVEWDSMQECFRSGLTTYAHVEAFEDALARRLGVKEAIATSSGTAALHAVLIASGVVPNDAVIVPAMTFMGTASAVVQCGATPVFVDASRPDYGIMPHKLGVFLERETQRGRLRKTGQRIAAVIAVDVFGRPCRFGEIEQQVVASLGPDVPVIEDAAEALGSRHGERHCGTMGAAAVLSFNNNKIVTTGGGGAVVTNDTELARLVRRLITTGRMPHRFHIAHDMVGFNYRMPNICAAIGIAQLARLDQMLLAKKRLAQAYEGALTAVPGVTFQRAEAGTAPNHWLNVIEVSIEWPGGRDEILTTLWDGGLMGRAAFTPLHKLKPFAGAIADNPLVAEHIHRDVVCLPSGAGLGWRFM